MPRVAKTYAERAAEHSVRRSGHLIWQGHKSNGVPRVRRKPTDTSARGPVNLRVALLEERDGGRPPGAYTATTTCGVDDCVEIDHLAWETRAGMYQRFSATAAAREQPSDARYREGHRRYTAEGWDLSEVATWLGVNSATLRRHWQRLGLSA